MSEFVVMPLDSNDLDTVARLHAESFDDPWSVPIIRRVLAMPGAFGLVARPASDELVAGFALGRITVDECELLSLGVDQSRRQQGIGGLLLDAAIARAILADARRFFLEVAEDNDAAIRLYSNRRLEQVGRRDNYYELKGGGYASALTMRRLLPLAESDPD